MWRTRCFWAVIAAASAAGVVLRLWHVFAEPLWLDEAYSAFAADHGFAFLWQVVPRYETHPPFYYSLLHLWVLAAGDGLVALRLPGLIAGFATLPVIAAAALRAGTLLGWSGERRRWLAAIAFVLACLAEQLVQMSRQVRPYPLMILAYALAIWLLLGLRARAAVGRPIAGRTLLAYLLLVEAMLWLHNLGPLYATALTAALGVALAWVPLRPADRAWLALGHAVVAIAYLPGLAILSGQAPTWIATTWVRLDAGGVLDHLQLLFAAPGPAAFAAIGLAAAALVAARGRIALMLSILAALPVALSLLLSITVAPIFITRTMTPALVPAVMLYAIGATAWRGWRESVALVAAAMFALGSAWADWQDRLAGPMQDWYAVVDWLAPRVGPGDVILAYPNEGALPLAYALRDKARAMRVVAVPRPVPAFTEPGAWYPTGSRGVVSLGPVRLRAIANAPATRAVPTLWLLRLGKRAYDPGDAFLRELRHTRRQRAGWRVGDIDVRGLSAPAEPIETRP